MAPEDASTDHPRCPYRHRNAQVPDLTFDCNIRARRRRRRRLSGGATQTGRYGSRTGLVCPSPARMAARQSSDPTDLSTHLSRGRPRRRLHLGKLGRVRRYRSMQPSIAQTQPIMLDGGTTPGCLPPARGAARERIIDRRYGSRGSAPKSVLIRAKPGKTALPFKSVLIPTFLRHIRFRRDYYNPV